VDLSKIKQLVKSNGDKFIMIENGEPELVVLSFGEYRKLVEQRPELRTHSRDSRASVYNPQSPLTHFEPPTASLAAHTEVPDHEESLQETEFDAVETEKSAGLPVRLEDIRLEDLPI
jgi:hypothetical protein